jgi:hypothetical protein
MNAQQLVGYEPNRIFIGATEVYIVQSFQDISVLLPIMSNIFCYDPLHAAFCHS